MRLLIATGFVLALCAGCSTTGGTVLGLFPAPKVLEGRIENDTYYAADGSFSIACPFEKGTPSYTYMTVKEQYNDVGAGVSQITFRVEIGKRLTPSANSVGFADAARETVANYRRQLASGHGTEPAELEHAETTVGTLPALRWVFVQDGKTALKHVAYALDGGNSVALLWVQFERSCLCVARADSFAQSFKFTNTPTQSNNALRPIDSPRFARLVAAERGRWT